MTELLINTLVVMAICVILVMVGYLAGQHDERAAGKDNKKDEQESNASQLVTAELLSTRRL